MIHRKNDIRTPFQALNYSYSQLTINPKQLQTKITQISPANIVIQMKQEIKKYHCRAFPHHQYKKLKKSNSFKKLTPHKPLQSLIKQPNQMRKTQSDAKNFQVPSFHNYHQYFRSTVYLENFRHRTKQSWTHQKFNLKNSLDAPTLQFFQSQKFRANNQSNKMMSLYPKKDQFICRKSQPLRIKLKSKEKSERKSKYQKISHISPWSFQTPQE